MISCGSLCFLGFAHSHFSHSLGVSPTYLSFIRVALYLKILLSFTIPSLMLIGDGFESAWLENGDEVDYDAEARER